MEKVYLDFAPAAQRGYLIVGFARWTWNNNVAMKATAIKTPNGEWEVTPFSGTEFFVKTHGEAWRAISEEFYQIFKA